MYLKHSLGWLFLLVAFSLSGCSRSIYKTEQPEGNSSLVADSQNQFGQTFTAQYSGLDGVAIDLEPLEGGQGDITLHLRADPIDSIDLRTSRIALSELKKRETYKFVFEPVQESSQRSFYMLVDLPAGGRLAFRTGSAESYPDGALYLNGSPQEAQLQFGLSYSWKTLLFGLISEGFVWLHWLLAGLFLFFLPGWGILSAGWLAHKERHWIEILGISLGISLAVYPVLMVLADMFGLSPGRWFAWAPGILGAASGFWVNRNRAKSFLMGFSLKHPHKFVQDPPVLSKILAELVLMVALMLLIFSRFWTIRALDAPMWGDSVHHTAIAQLILDNGGLFTSWEPYSPHRSFGMQFGFSASAALFAWLTGLPAHRSVLIGGQLINLISVISLLPLAYRFGRRSLWGANMTLTAAGLLSWMPAFYVNWGRYAQLTGQAIIPVALWLLWDFVERISISPKQTDARETVSKNKPQDKLQSITPYRFVILSFIVGIVLAGMVLSSYRLIIFFLTYLPGFMLALWLSARDRKGASWRSLMLALVSCAAAALIFLAPWIPRLISNPLTKMVAEGMAQTPQSERVLEALLEWGNLEIYQPWYLITAALVSFSWSIFRRRWDSLSIGLWIMFTQLYYLGQLAHVPLANMIQVFAILIWLYIPVSLLVGVIFAAVIEQLEKLGAGRSLLLLLAVLLILIAAYGANQASLLSRPLAYAMVTRPDLRAMEWIRKNTVEGSKFLIEGSRVLSKGTFVGTDAGWWIPILAGRENTIPPQYAFGVEKENIPGQMQDYVGLAVLLEDRSPGDPLVKAALCRQGITHVYIGQRQGMIGSGTGQLFSPKELVGDPNFRPVYHQDRVYIFEVDRNACILN